MNVPLILASKSPRRQQLLAELGFQFQSMNAECDESIYPEEPALSYVQRVAYEKAAVVKHRLTNDDQQRQVILAADTCVVIDQQILGKPANYAEFRQMLKQLSGRTHQVYTAIIGMQAEHNITQVVSSEVTFKLLSTTDIDWYWQTGEPQDKAGGYGIQGLAGRFVQHINGSYSAIVGLPLVETTELLAQFAVVPLLLNKPMNKTVGQYER